MTTIKDNKGMAVRFRKGDFYFLIFSGLFV